MIVLQNVPLERFAHALLGCKPYAFIDDVDADIIRAAQGYDALYVIENDAATFGMAGHALGVAPKGQCRLWLIKDWTICDNKRRDAVARIDTAHAAQRSKVDTCIQGLVSKGISVEVARMVLGSMSTDAVNSMYTNITGGAI